MTKDNVPLLGDQKIAATGWDDMACRQVAMT